MGILSLVALIPAIQGNIGTSLCMLGADWLLNSQSKNDTPQVYTVTKKDWGPICRWALGDKFFSSLMELVEKGTFDNNQKALEEIIVERWNKMRGKWLYLYGYEPFEINFQRISKKWVNHGCPGAY